jgi:hypothetical protein
MSDHSDTVVVKDGGSGAALLIGIIILVVVAAAAWYLLMGPGAGTTSPNDINVNVELPSVAPASS